MRRRSPSAEPLLVRLLARPALVVGIGLGVFLAACGSSDPSPTAAPVGGDLAEGEALYAANCASCHGADLRGTERGPSHLSIVYEPNHHGDDSFRSAMSNGAPQHHWDFGAMPPVAGLSADEQDAIIAYIRDVQEREGFER